MTDWCARTDHLNLCDYDLSLEPLESVAPRPTCKETGSRTRAEERREVSRLLSPDGGGESPRTPSVPSVWTGVTLDPPALSVSLQFSFHLPPPPLFPFLCHSLSTSSSSSLWAHGPSALILLCTVLLQMRQARRLSNPCIQRYTSRIGECSSTNATTFSSTSGLQLHTAPHAGAHPKSDHGGRSTFYRSPAGPPVPRSPISAVPSCHPEWGAGAAAAVVACDARPQPGVGQRALHEPAATAQSRPHASAPVPAGDAAGEVSREPPPPPPPPVAEESPWRRRSNFEPRVPEPPVDLDDADLPVSEV
ncbi:hypothetical protein EYF80_020103 [Liparis tanakae]|uniref:Uncharacterized protein n=1 Tax=Liparis tanakae TaxID=230148 RepID=A0A4Z2HXC9_9TELE|nr:hypothetical protein EYF80_020103 [Liparis tanakae]